MSGNKTHRKADGENSLSKMIVLTSSFVLTTMAVMSQPCRSFVMTPSRRWTADRTMPVLGIANARQERRLSHRSRLPFLRSASVPSLDGTDVSGYNGSYHDKDEDNGTRSDRLFETTATSAAPGPATVLSPASSGAATDLPPLSGRYYQLEQLEEDYSILTEVFLHRDGTVHVGCTDGPRFNDAWGVWREQAKEGYLATDKDESVIRYKSVFLPDDDDDETPDTPETNDAVTTSHTHFAMSITQEFEGGNEGHETIMRFGQKNKVGSFPFQVERTFVGERTMVGGKLAISGKIYYEYANGHEQDIGYFHLIDTTQERLGENEEDGGNSENKGGRLLTVKRRQ